jgi:tripartite-type tricarboxylate transporter receptor subunit TctC
VKVMFPTMPAASIQYVRIGKLRALAVTSATRSEALSDVPSVGEFVPGYEARTKTSVLPPTAHETLIIRIPEAACQPGAREVRLGSWTQPGSATDIPSTIY